MKKLFIMLILALGVFLLIEKENYIVIPSSSIRMRVIAASNNPKDIENKIIVKKELEKELTNIVKNTKDVNEADYEIRSNEEGLKKTINDTLKKNNINSSFNVNYGDNYFPEKKYNGVLYKSGNYKSYVVTLGKGEGDNFWCVLFPPLCLIDDANKADYRFLIKDILSKYD